MKQRLSSALKRLDGFTLLELLVVISVIAILITLGLSSYGTAQKKSRDAKRKADLKDVQNALEQFYSVCGYQYPTPEASFYTSIVCTTPGVSIAIMPTVPIDPRNITPYYCPDPSDESCTGEQYTICSGLEADSTNTFCVSNQQ